MGPGIDGRGNPAGRQKPFETFDQLFVHSFDRARTSIEMVRIDPFADHLVALGEASAERQPDLRADLYGWADNLRNADLPLSANTRVLVVALAATVTLTRRIGATWRLLLD